MKKQYFILISLLVLCVASCRKEGDYFLNPNDVLNIQGGRESANVITFENIWSAINTGYVFWDITDVDWDQRYLEYKPQFEQLDSDYNQGKYETEEAYLAYLKKLYDGLLSGLKDGHMIVRAGTVTGKYISSRPSAENNKDRMHTDTNGQEFRSTFLPFLAENGNVSEFDSCHFIMPDICAGHAGCVYTLSNGKKVPYLWNSDFVDTTTVQEFLQEEKDPEQLANARKWQPIYNRFIDNFLNTPRSELGGVILDLRTNGGGEMASIPNYINIFAGQKHTYWETRYKEGMGRYEMSAWVPFEMGMPERYRDCEAENIPIVVLCDVNSVSCAEITTGSIKQMPTAHIVGERTWGGHGPLSGSDNTHFNETYGGISGSPDMSLSFFVYTSNYENRPVGGPVLEGIGITPDEEVLYKEVGYQGQFEAAIRYLESLN